MPNDRLVQSDLSPINLVQLLDNGIPVAKVDVVTFQSSFGRSFSTTEELVDLQGLLVLEKIPRDRQLLAIQGKPSSVSKKLGISVGDNHVFHTSHCSIGELLI